MKTDAQLQQDVMAELAWEPSVHATQIGVEVKGGVVTLAGEVGSFAEKWSAERAAQRVSGVLGLAIELKVRLSELGHHSSADIATAASHILAWSSSLPKDSVKVAVEDGWLTLSGQVEWQFQRQSAEESLRHLAGVTGISNQISLRPLLSSSGIQHGIQAALERRGSAEGLQIEVGVQGSEVTLRGKVHNWAERDVVTRSAWAASGVNKVVDKMTVAA